MSKIIFLFFTILFCSVSYGQSTVPNYYIPMGQIEESLSHEWDYLHGILETKKWIFDEVTEDKDYIYHYKRLDLKLKIRLENRFPKDGRRQIWIYTFDESYYWNLKDQINKSKYELVSPNLYKKGNYTIAISSGIETKNGNTTYFDIVFTKHPVRNLQDK